MILVNACRHNRANRIGIKSKKEGHLGFSVSFYAPVCRLGQEARAYRITISGLHIENAVHSRDEEIVRKAAQKVTQVHDEGPCKEKRLSTTLRGKPTQGSRTLLWRSLQPLTLFRENLQSAIHVLPE